MPLNCVVNLLCVSHLPTSYIPHEFQENIPFATTLRNTLVSRAPSSLKGRYPLDKGRRYCHLMYSLITMKTMRSHGGTSPPEAR